ncbi:MAG: hypothetical protein KatS3mg027_0748 [Bacteroidia bacterium]|nr:MAG: hypothetical protein KatS3mg027_0748 [Bacteroidia bacterium]
MKTKLLVIVGVLLWQIIYSQEEVFESRRFNPHISFLGNQVIDSRYRIRAPIPSVRTLYVQSNDKKIYEDQALQYLPLTSVHYEWDRFINPAWYYQDSSTYLYYTTSPNTGKLLEEKIYSDSLPNYRVIYRYDNLGRKQCVALHNFNHWTNEWIPANRDTFYYTSSNKPSVIEDQNYDYSTQTFCVVTKYVRNYNIYNKLVSEKVYRRFNCYDTLKLDYQISVYYNSQQKYTSIIYEEFDNNNVITYKTKESYFYDSNGKIKEAIEMEWNYNTNKWDTLGKILTTWYKWISNDIEDLCNNLPSTFIFQQRYASGVYLNSEKYEYYYDPIDDENIEEKDYIWDGTIGNWIWDWGRKEILTRNAYYGNMITQKIVQYKQGANENYENYAMYIYKQPSPTYVLQNDPEAHILTIFPNPNKGQFYLLLNTSSRNIHFYITDIMGRKVDQNVMFSEIQDNIFSVNTSNLQKGVYFVNAKDENTGSFYLQKIIIE